MQSLITSQRDLQAASLKVLEQIQALLADIEQDTDNHSSHHGCCCGGVDGALLATVAEMTALWIERNTALLSEITLFPEGEPKGESPTTEEEM